eukprot:m51a1_g11084 hypothetical protein (657) ;mRNA; r:3931-5901
MDAGSGLRCGVCRQDYAAEGPRRPLSLSCGHSVCSACSATPRCPSCRCDASVCSRPSALAPLVALVRSCGLEIPPDTVGDVSPEESPAADAAPARCDACSEAEAAVWCPQCRGRLCAQCDARVHALAFARGHQRDSRIPHVIAESTEYLLGQCPDHHEPLSVFCTLERQLCCWRCAYAGGRHHGHATVLRSEAAEPAIAAVQSALDDVLAPLLSSAPQTAAAVASALQEADASAAKATARVRAAFGCIRTALDSRERELVQTVAEAASSAREALRETGAAAVAEADLALAVASAARAAVRLGPSHAGAVDAAEALCRAAREARGRSSHAASAVAAAAERARLGFFGAAEAAELCRSLAALGSVAPRMAAPKLSVEAAEGCVRASWRPAEEAGQACCYELQARGARAQFQTVYTGPQCSCEVPVDAARMSLRLRVRDAKGPHAWGAVATVEAKRSPGAASRAGGPAGARPPLALLSYNGKGVVEYRSTWAPGPNYKLDDRCATATNTGGVNGTWDTTVVARAPLASDAVTRWGVRVARTCGSTVMIGVAPRDIRQTEQRNYAQCGWYLFCRDCSLYSGPPQRYNGREYRLSTDADSSKRMLQGNDVVVQVEVDPQAGEVVFISGDMCGPVAFQGLPSGTALVPVVILRDTGDVVELL